ncbi:MAG TPA: AAA family ATPase [Pedococcus sp.]|nr:AAA family ATPase [Pedococcus sp.]
MLTASRSLRRAAKTGAAMPEVSFLSALHGAGVHFRPGQVVLVTGRPGAGKSNLVQSICTEWATEHDLTTLYYSLDMDPFTVGVRQAAAITGHPQERISAAMDGPGEAYYEAELDGIPIAYCFDTRPELPDIQDELDAYVELYDAYPAAMVIDNLLNIECGEGGHGDQKFVMRNMQELARRTGSCLFVLHHAREGVKDTTRPPTMAETDNKMNQIPEVILGVAHDDDTGEMSVAALKVRVGGKSDPAAERPFRLTADFSTMQFSAGRPTKSTSALDAYWSSVED